MNRGLVSRQDWERTYGTLAPGLPDEDHCVRRWIEERLPGGDGDCLEVGCYPGRLLACIGGLGYRLHGIDLIPQVETALPRWLADHGYRVGSFVQGDFFSFEPGRRYDVVASFGFIEHFEDWRAVVDRHIDLVAPGGHLLLTVPNFVGLLQRCFQATLNRESYLRHNLQAMHPRLWAEHLERRSFEILSCGYHGAVDYWVDEQRRSLPSRLLVHLLVRGCLPVLRAVLWRDSKLYSPMAGVIARRR